jgi:hypothetical protein
MAIFTAEYPDLLVYASAHTAIAHCYNFHIRKVAETQQRRSTCNAVSVYTDRSLRLWRCNQWFHQNNIMMFNTWLFRIASCLSLGAALSLPSITFGDETVGAPLAASSPAAASGGEFIGPPLPPASPNTAFGANFVGPPPPPVAPDAMNALDKPRNYLSGEFLDFVSYIDHFFGNDQNYQEANSSVMQLDIVRVAGYGGERKFVWSARANLRLPLAEQKLHLILETDPDRNATVNPKLTQSPPLAQPSTPQSYAAALRIDKIEAERWHLSLDGGLKFQGVHTSPFARTRAILAVPMEKWRAKLEETAFWFNSTGLGESTQLDLERPISEPMLFRATSVAVWLKSTHHYDLRQDLSLYHKLDDRNALLYQISAIGVSSPHTQVTDYVLLVLYRYRVHRDWMFLEVSPQLHFPKEQNYRRSPMLSMRLEMLFDETK